MHCSPHAHWLRVLVALLVLTGAGLTRPAHAADVPMGAAIWFTAAPSDNGQSQVCLCDALFSCTTAALGLHSAGESRYLRPRESFKCPAGVDALGQAPDVPLPPPKTA